MTSCKPLVPVIESHTKRLAGNRQADGDKPGLQVRTELTSATASVVARVTLCLAVLWGTHEVVCALTARSGHGETRPDLVTRGPEKKGCDC